MLFFNLMGCSGSRVVEDGINSPSEYKMDEIDIASIDKIFTELQKTIEEVEEIREAVIDKKDELIILSGAAAHISPDVEICFTSISWKISSDNEGKFIESGLYYELESKSIILTGHKNTEESKNALNKFNHYVKGIWNLPERTANLFESLSAQNKNIDENMDRYFNEISSTFSKENISKIQGKIIQIKNNQKKGNKAEKKCEVLNTEITKSIEFIKKIPKLLLDQEKLKFIDEIGAKAFVKKYKSTIEITWNSLPSDQRYGSSSSDGIKFWRNIIENKKILNLKNKKNILN